MGMTITYRNGFVVDLPEWAGEETDGWSRAS